MSNFCPVAVRLLSVAKFGFPPPLQVNSSCNKMAAACNSMKKKNWLLLIIVLTATLLIAIVFWIYAKRIKRIENKISRSRLSAHCIFPKTNINERQTSIGFRVTNRNCGK